MRNPVLLPNYVTDPDHAGDPNTSSLGTGLGDCYIYAGYGPFEDHSFIFDNEFLATVIDA